MPFDRDEGEHWLPMSTAPKNGTPIRLRVRRRIGLFTKCEEVDGGWFAHVGEAARWRDLRRPGLLINPLGWLPGYYGESDSFVLRAFEKWRDVADDPVAFARQHDFYQRRNAGKPS